MPPFSRLKLSSLRSYSFAALQLGLMIVLLGLSACGGPKKSQTADKLAQDSSAAQNFDNNLTFKDVTLEQVDEKGRLLWKVKAKQARYSKDQKVATVQNPAGELYQDGKAVYKIQAQSGEVRKDGQTILLKGQIVATDIQSGAIVKGNELEWQPKVDLLLVRNNITGTHPQVQAAAKEAKVYSRARRMEFFGQVAATSKDPALGFKSEHLIWEIAKQLIVVDKPVQIDRYVGTVVSDRAVADQAEVQLKTKVATLKQNAQLSIADPPLEIASNSLVWNLTNQTVVSDQRVDVLHREQRVAISANQGRGDLEPRIFYLTGNVQGKGERNQSQLAADNLTWYIPTQQIEATGNVVYTQADPPFNLKGPKASGTLQDQNIVVSGGRVVTEIIP
jgi:LPS export ABC transporter protein LptC